jgi:hypothetical protein
MRERRRQKSGESCAVRHFITVHYIKYYIRTIKSRRKHMGEACSTSGADHKCLQKFG